MPRTLQEIIDHQDELAEAFEQHEPAPDEHLDPAAFEALRNAAAQKAHAEQALAQAVTQARDAGYTWAAIGALLGTSGEAARQRYGQLAKH